MNLKTISRSLAFTAALVCSANVFAGDSVTSGTATADGKNAPSPIVQADPVSHDLISVESTYTGQSNVRNDGVIRGKQSSTFTDFNYGHRFHVDGNWYLRLGVEYQRFDFGGTLAPLPQHLQSINAIIAYEYVVKDFSAVAIELRPGFAYENNVTSKNFEIPFDIYTSFPIKKDKVFGLVGAFYGQNFKPEVSPIGGIIWLINDKTRLEALFPRPGLIYNVTDDLELRAGAEIGGWGFRQDANPRDNATFSGNSNARVQYSYYEAGLTATYKGWKPFEIAVGGGWDFEREFDYIHEVPEQKYHASGAPYIKLSLSAKF